MSISCPLAASALVGVTCVANMPQEYAAVQHFDQIFMPALHLAAAVVANLVRVCSAATECTYGILIALRSDVTCKSRRHVVSSVWWNVAGLSQ